MVHPDTPVPTSKFKVDFGGREVPQFFRVNLPSARIPAIEHEVGSAENYPIKHADQAEHHGTFTLELYVAKGGGSSVEEWFKELKNYTEDTREESISVTLQDQNGEDVVTWEFDKATILKYEFAQRLSGGQALKAKITVSYQDMRRKVA